MQAFARQAVVVVTFCFAIGGSCAKISSQAAGHKTLVPELIKSLREQGAEELGSGPEEIGDALTVRTPVTEVIMMCSCRDKFTTL